MRDVNLKRCVGARHRKTTPRRIPFHISDALRRQKLFRMPRPYSITNENDHG